MYVVGKLDTYQREWGSYAIEALLGPYETAEEAETARAMFEKLQHPLLVGVEYRVFGLTDPEVMVKALKEMRGDA